MSKFIEDFRKQEWQYLLIETENNSGSTNFVLQLLENSIDNIDKSELAFNKLLDTDTKIIYVGNEYFSEKELDKVKKLKQKSTIYFLINQSNIPSKAKELVETSRYHYIILDNVNDLFDNSSEIIQLYEAIVQHKLKLIVCKSQKRTSNSVGQRMLNGSDLSLRISTDLTHNTYEINMNSLSLYKKYVLKIE